VQGSEQPARSGFNFIDGMKKCRLIRLRGAVESADLAYELQRGGPNLIVCDRRFEVEQGLDASTHGRNHRWTLVCMSSKTHKDASNQIHMRDLARSEHFFQGAKLELMR
jgi:hypothetical protein